MEYSEKPEPRYLCPNPKCGIFCTVAEVYFENNHEKETPDQTGYGSIGSKRKIPENVQQYVYVDLTYLDKLPKEIRDSIFLGLFEHGKTDLKDLRYEHVQQVLAKLHHQKGDQYYADLKAHAYSIFCAIRGAPLIEFNDEELINRIAETSERFDALWSELRPADRVRSVRTIVAFPFTLLTLGFPKETVQQFYSTDQFINFTVDEELFKQISAKMNIHPPILFSTICPKFVSSHQMNANNSSDGIFTDEDGFDSLPMEITPPPPPSLPPKEIAKPVAKKQSKITSLPKLGFKILK